MSKIAWCKSHYRTDFAKEKAKELRNMGYKVSFGSYVKESGQSYCKIYLERDFNYYVLSILNSIQIRVNQHKFEFDRAVKEFEEDIKKIERAYDVPIDFFMENNQIIADINGEFELKI